jgi:hypothetical protein
MRSGARARRGDGAAAFVCLVGALTALSVTGRPIFQERQPHLTASPISAFRWWRIHLRRRQGLADRLGSEFGANRPQRVDARRERVSVALDDVVKLLG